MSDNVALSWNRVGLEVVRRTRMGPPIVARALHVLHASMYDAWAAHHDRAFGSRLGDRLRRPPAEQTQEARPEAASFAAHRALVDLFPTEATAFAKLMGELGYVRRPSGPRGRRAPSGSRRPGRCWPCATATAPTSSATSAPASRPSRMATGPATGRSTT